MQIWESVPSHDRRNFLEGYRYARKYFVMSRNRGHNELFSKKANQHGTYPSVVHLGNIFDCIQSAHNNVNHSKRKTLQSLLRERHSKTIPMWIRKLYTDLCPTCIQIREVRKHQKAVHRPTLSKHYGNVDKQILSTFRLLSSKVTNISWFFKAILLSLWSAFRYLTDVPPVFHVLS